MPDWREFVEKRLGATALADHERDEAIVELASHLEEIYQEQRARGLPETEAVERAEAEVANWRVLTRRIEKAKRQENEMNHRTLSVWIPGMVSLTGACGFLALLQVWGVRPHIVWTRSGLALQFYIPWLVAQPVFGAIGAYISRQNGGNWNERLTASLLPAASMVGAFCVILCVAIVLSGITDGYEPTCIGISLYILSWAVVPGLMLALGALPFLGPARIQRAN